ncbi:serine/threonine protein kinase [Butyrivibrio hungatei]|uniref:Serine/threonine protein kinase n=1 Tax=Butyrivibrio hungatei TaxID=185008 RepID=A0A1D9NZQ7_9FIRM|nr:serine/threonine-protein kinase [Butyrivibrio hungatei]AOZ95753.1 serine/threonine protein kinase [Butyrivibrio hungatei]
MLEIGSIVGGKYKVLSVIGQGGMSTVYLAMNERANKPWAIKEVRKDAVANYQTVRQSLITETDLLKELSHPFLPSIVDVIDEDGGFLIVMDYIEGNTLEKALKHMGAQPQEYVIEWGIQLCEVLEYLHTRKTPIIYRDLKPGNIMLRPNGTITLIDFGIAREYKEAKAGDTSYLGTRGYAAPEQFGGMGQTDARTDIFCLGATLYHLVTGHNPSEPPYEFYPIRYWNQQLSPGLEYIISKCVQSNPDDRYNSCAEVMYDLQNYRELEKGYKKEAKISVLIFAAIIVLSLFTATLSVNFQIKSRKLANAYYQHYIAEAKGTADESEAANLYAKAIAEKPTDVDGYFELIDNLLLADDILSKEEDEELRKILISPVGKTTVEGALSTNKQAYSEVAYRLGIAYFYCYDDVGNKQLAAKWFQIVNDNGGLSKDKQERAFRLGKICQYYSSIGTEFKSGDKVISYREYWDDLVAISDGNIAEVDNPTTALVIYREVAAQIYNNAAKFIEAGVTYDEMSKEMDTLLAHIDEDILTRYDLTNSTKELVSKTQRNFTAAKQALDQVGK